MKITYYKDAAMEETTTEMTKGILGMLDSDEITDVDRKAVRNGEFMPMCNFYSVESGYWKAVPWQRIIEIDE